jgi:outer membrane immunogenic protein
MRRARVGRGFTGGLQLGYNWGGGHWLFGVETDAQTSDVKGSAGQSPIIQNNGTPFFAGSFIKVSSQTQWWGSTRLRLGHSWGPNANVYLTGGAAYGRVQFTGNTDFRPTGTTDYATSFTKFETGWIAGAGFAHLLDHGAGQ